MRVITGSAKGMQLKSLDYETRPLSDRAKSALFSIIETKISGSQILDLYAGSGALGIEALSRGARFAVFCDISKKSIESIRLNLTKTRFTDKAEVFQIDAHRYISKYKHEKFDIIFVSPPYNEVKFHTIKKSAFLLTPSGILIFEHHKKDVFRQIDGLTKVDERQYGIVCFEIYMNETG